MIVYLINHMLIIVLKGHTSFKSLFKSYIDYCFLYIFRCLRFLYFAYIIDISLIFYLLFAFFLVMVSLIWVINVLTFFSKIIHCMSCSLSWKYFSFNILWTNFTWFIPTHNHLSTILDLVSICHFFPQPSHNITL